MTTPDWVIATLKVIDALDALDVPYVVCGSAASIIHGTVRTTLDSDLIADLKHEHVKLLISALAEEFYINAESIIAAIASRSSFNLIHQATMFRVDVFIPKARTFDVAQLAHRVEMTVSREPMRTAWILSAEDVVLAKLDWFRLGDEVSERQWRDVLGVLKTQSGQLDLDYMRKMASTLGVSDLLERALQVKDQ